MGMELRVLMPIARGHTFYEDWGYKFGRAGFGQSMEDWDAAVQGVGRVSLDMLMEMHRCNFAICSILDRYRMVCFVWR